MTPEGRIESYLKKQCELHNFLCYKFTAPSTMGVPDRIVIGNGRVVFVELKAPGKKPRPLQLVIHKKMREHGAEVIVIDTKQGVDAFIQQLIEK